jgi:hypothetical protein
MPTGGTVPSVRIGDRCVAVRASLEQARAIVDAVTFQRVFWYGPQAFWTDPEGHRDLTWLFVHVLTSSLHEVLQVAGQVSVRNLGNCADLTLEQWTDHARG